MKHQLINVFQQEVESFDDMEREGRKILRPIVDDKYKNPNFQIRTIKNPESGKWFGIPIGNNPDGSIKFQKIVINGTRVFELANKQDAMEWHVIKNAPFVLGSKFKSGKPVFEVYDEVKESRNTIEKGRIAMKAIAFIDKMAWEELKDFCRLFNLNPDFSNEDVIRGQMIEMAMENPMKIIEKTEMKGRLAIAMKIKKALAFRIISYEIGKGYMTNDGLFCGATEEGVITFFQDNIDSLSRISELANSEEQKLNQKKKKPESKKPTKKAEPEEVSKAVDEAFVD